MSHKSWKEFKLKENQIQTIYRDWGKYYMQQQQYENAATFLNNAIELKADDVTALYHRSLYKSDITDTAGALVDALAALNLDESNYLLGLQVGNATYESNLLEKSNVQLVAQARKFTGNKAKAFIEKNKIIEENLLDSVGDSAGPFFNKNAKIIPGIIEKLRNDQKIDGRPLWKLLRDKNECDAISILGEEKKQIHILDKSRTEQNYLIFNQIYFGKAWKDILFLNSLKTDKRLLLKQTPATTPILMETLNDHCSTVKKFSKMLHTRSPIYNQKYKMFRNKQYIAEEYKLKHLKRLQESTRKEMFNISNKIIMLRKGGNLEELMKFTEKSMGDHVDKKTLRVLPRKFEFINEIYNIIALAYCDQLIVPENIYKSPPKDRMFLLLKLPTEKDKIKPTPYIFGDYSTYQEPDVPDYKLIEYKRIITRLEHRLEYAKYPIEKCYLLHEIAKQYIQQSKLDEARIIGKKIIHEANNCQNKLWMFLGALSICCSDTIQRKVENIKESLDKAAAIAKKLQNSRIIHFMNVCSRINQINIEMKQSLSEEMIFKAKESLQISGSRRFNFITSDTELGLEE